jgi:hypothetical protein
VSWDIRWRLRRAADGARFAAAVREVVAELGFEATVEDAVAHVKLPRDFCVLHAVRGIDVPPEDWCWGTLELSEDTRYPLDDDSPYEVLSEALLDGNGESAREVRSLCLAGDRLLAATSSEHTFQLRAGSGWDELDWPDDYDDRLPVCVGFDGKTAWGGGVRLFEIGNQIIPDPVEPERYITVIGGHAGRCVAAGELVHVRDEGGWRRLDHGSLGFVAGIAAGEPGIYVSADGALLARVDADRVTPIAAPSHITDGMSGTHAMTIAHDGAVWLASSGFIARYDGAWTRARTDIERPAALLTRDRDIVLIGDDAEGVIWDGSTWEGFTFDVDRSISCACLDGDGDIVVGDDAGIVHHLVPRGPMSELVIHSNISANREAWGAICEVGEAVARKLGAGPGR